MNAAARAINQNTLFQGQLLHFQLSKQFGTLLTVLMLVLCSALAVVYITNEYRSSFSQLQQLEQKMNDYQLRWGQLLLEQASLATPARVEEMASYKLQMHLPIQKTTLVIHIK